jgi:hypothetical protein
LTPRNGYGEPLDTSRTDHSAPTISVCNNTCEWSADGECDEEDYCADGTDCADCGPSDVVAMVCPSGSDLGSTGAVVPANNTLRLFKVQYTV